jgi:hypothetical protein
MTLDRVIADLTARYPGPAERDAAIAGAVDNWLHHETTRPKERA